MGKVGNWFKKTVTLERRMAILGLITIIAVTVAIMSLINQAKLKAVIDLQSTQISELLKAKKDMKFSQDASNDSGITAIGELKTMVQNLNNKVNAQPAVLGTAVTVPYLGSVEVNIGTTGSLMSGENTTTPVAEVTPGAILFYLKKENGWYQVETTDNKSGWLPAESVTEINQ